MVGQFRRPNPYQICIKMISCQETCFVAQLIRGKKKDVMKNNAADTEPGGRRKKANKKGIVRMKHR